MEYAFDFEENIDVALLIETLQAGGFKKPYNSSKERGLTEFFMKHEDGAIVKFIIKKDTHLTFELAPKRFWIRFIKILILIPIMTFFPDQALLRLISSIDVVPFFTGLIVAFAYGFTITASIVILEFFHHNWYKSKYDYILSDTYDVIEKM